MTFKAFTAKQFPAPKVIKYDYEQDNTRLETVKGESDYDP